MLSGRKIMQVITKLWLQNDPRKVLLVEEVKDCGSCQNNERTHWLALKAEWEHCHPNILGW